MSGGGQPQSCIIFILCMLKVYKIYFLCGFLCILACRFFFKFSRVIARGNCSFTSIPRQLEAAYFSFFDKAFGGVFINYITNCKCRQLGKQPCHYASLHHASFWVVVFFEYFLLKSVQGTHFLMLFSCVFDVVKCPKDAFRQKSENLGQNLFAVVLLAFFSIATCLVAYPPQL